MKRILILAILMLTACSATPSTKAVVNREGVSSAVVNLNVMNREASIGALSAESANLFEAEVGDLAGVDFAAELAEQAFIVLGDSNPDESIWQVNLNPSIPTAFVLDANDATVNANLDVLSIPLFDVVSTNSILNIETPARDFQLALDANNSTVNLNLPNGALMQVNQFTSNSSFITLTAGEGVAFDAVLSITAGGLSVNVPASTGVQIVVESAEQAEITLPEMERIGAEVMSYQTMNFSSASTQIILRVNLVGAAIRVAQG